MNWMKKIGLMVLAGVLVAGGLQAEEKQTLRVYHVGNSLTMSLRLDRLSQLFEQRGIDYQFGSQISGGKSLIRHWNYTKEPDQKWASWEANVPKGSGWGPSKNMFTDPNPKRFGLYDKALPEHEWDVVVLQTYGGSLKEDLEACGNFIELALKKSPQAKFYIYTTWPQRPRGGKPGKPIDYEKAWLETYAFGPDSAEKANHGTRDYHEKLIQHLSERHKALAHPIRMVPGGEVLFELDQAIKKEQIPGIQELFKRSPEHLPGMTAESKLSDGVNLLYADSIHLNPVPHGYPALGLMAMSMTMCATLSGNSPVGLSGSIYDLDDQKDAELIKATQELVWKVVSNHPHSGVSATNNSGDKHSTNNKSDSIKATMKATVKADAGAVDFNDWRGQVKEKKVVQPETDVSSEWKFTPHPFPPMEQLLSQKPDPLPVYGVYHWGPEYTKFRKEIKAVGWKSYRMGGFIDEEALAMAMEDGMEIMMTLQIGRTLEELKTIGKRNAFKSDEEFIQKYLECLGDFCSKYGPGGSFFSKRPDLAKNPVRYVEIWNEPNFKYMISDQRDMAAVRVERDKLYIKLLKESGAFIKAKFPEIQVVGFAAGGASFDDKRFVTNVYASEPSIGKYYDIFSTHPYTSTPPMADRVKKWGSFSIAGGLKDLREIMEKNGDAGKTVWYTEIGWKIRHSDGGMFPDKHTGDFPHPAMVQAANVTKVYLLAMRLGVRRVHIMSVADADHFNSGFFDHKSGEWRPSAHATQQLIRMLPNPKILAAISEVPGELYAYQFKSDVSNPGSADVIVAWKEQAKGEISLPVPAGKRVVKLYNMIGGEETFSVSDNHVRFAGGPLPSYLLLD